MHLYFITTSLCCTVSENDFRDKLVLQIIDKYGRHSTSDIQPGHPSCSDCRVRHGSVLSSSKRCCQYCKVVGKPAKLTQRSAQIVWGNQHFARLAIAIATIATPCGIHHHLIECAICGLRITSRSNNNSSSHSNPQLQLHRLPQQEFPDNQDALGVH